MMRRGLLDWRREFLALAVAVMETCWLSLWIDLALGFMAGPAYGISFLYVLLWVYLSMLVVRLLDNFELDLIKRQLIVMGIGLVAILGVLKASLYGGFPLLSLRWLGVAWRDVMSIWLLVPPQVVILLLGLLAWWRGIRLGQMSLGSAEVGVRFRFGVLAFMFYLIMTALMQEPVPEWGLVGFFFASLIAIAVARVIELEAQRGGVRSPFGANWFSILVGSAAVVVLIGIFVAGVLSLDNVKALLDSLQPIFAPLRQLVAIVIALFFSIVFVVGGYLARWLRRLLGGPVEAPEVIEDGGILDQFGSELDPLQAWQALKVGRDTVLVAVVLLAILLVLVAVRRGRKRRLAQRDVTRESVWSTEAFGQDLADWLRGGLQRVRDGVANGLSWLQGRYALTSIREVYASVLKLAARQGVERATGETPTEFAPDLQAIWPEQEAEIAWLTEAYEDAHYGHRADSPDALSRANVLWQHLRTGAMQSESA